MYFRKLYPIKTFTGDEHVNSSVHAGSLTAAVVRSCTLLTRMAVIKHKGLVCPETSD